MAVARIWSLADMPVVVPQPQFVDKVFAIPVVLQKQIPMMSTVQLTMQIPQLQSTDKVVFVLRVRVVQVPQMLVVEVFRSHSCSLLRKSLRSTLASLSLRTGRSPWSRLF